MQLFLEAGVFSFAALALFAVGLFDVARGKGRTPTWAAAIAGVSLFGCVLGQRLVAEVVAWTPAIDDKVRFLAEGTKEATANLVLGGAFVVVLLAIDAAISWRRKPA